MQKYMSFDGVFLGYVFLVFLGYVFLVFPANIYLFKVINRNFIKRCEICPKLTIKPPEQHKQAGFVFTRIASYTSSQLCRVKTFVK